MSMVSCLFVAKPAWAFEVKVKPAETTGSTIAELQWKNTQPVASYQKPEKVAEGISNDELVKQVKLIVKVIGVYPKSGKGWTLLMKGKPLEISSDGRFEINFVALGKTQAVELTAVSDEGVIETEKVAIEIENFEEFLAELKEGESAHSWSVQAGLLESRYSQSNVKLVSQRVVEVAAVHTWRLSKDALPLRTSVFLWAPGSEAKPGLGKIYYYGADTQIEKDLPLFENPEGPWDLSVSLGLFTRGMMVFPSRFGYSGSTGGLLESELGYLVSEKNRVSVRLTFGLVADGFEPATLLGQQLRRVRVRWESAFFGEDLKIFAEAAMHQFLLREGSVSELTSGGSLGVAF